MAKIEKNLYRAAHTSQFPDGVWREDGEIPADGILHGDITARTIHRKGRKPVTRQDWRAYQDGKYKRFKGTSLHDKKGVLGYGSFNYFTLPQGTDIPASLTIRFTNYDDERNANHYQIEVRNGGELDKDALKGALDNLARNCVVRLKELNGQTNEGTKVD